MNKIPSWFSVMISGLAEVFPGNSASFSPARARAYWIALEDVPRDALNLAAKIALQTCRYMPTPAELRDFAGVNTTAEQRAERAFEIVNHAMRTLSRDASVNFGPLVNRVICQMGGLREIAEQSGQEWAVWGRKRFIETFINLEGADHYGAPESLPGEIERINEYNRTNGRGLAPIYAVPMMDLSREMLAIGTGKARALPALPEAKEDK